MTYACYNALKHFRQEVDMECTNVCVCEHTTRCLSYGLLYTFMGHIHVDLCHAVRVYDVRMIKAHAKGGPWCYCLVPEHLRTDAWALLVHNWRGRQISAVKFSHDGRHVLASYSGEHIYSFSTSRHCRMPEEVNQRSVHAAGGRPQGCRRSANRDAPTTFQGTAVLHAHITMVDENGMSHVQNVHMPMPPVSIEPQIQYEAGQQIDESTRQPAGAVQQPAASRPGASGSLRITGLSSMQPPAYPMWRRHQASRTHESSDNHSRILSHTQQGIEGNASPDSTRGLRRSARQRQLHTTHTAAVSGGSQAESSGHQTRQSSAVCTSHAGATTSTLPPPQSLDDALRTDSQAETSQHPLSPIGRIDSAAPPNSNIPGPDLQPTGSDSSLPDLIPDSASDCSVPDLVTNSGSDCSISEWETSSASDGYDPALHPLGFPAGPNASHHVLHYRFPVDPFIGGSTVTMQQPEQTAPEVQQHSQQHASNIATTPAERQQQQGGLRRPSPWARPLFPQSILYMLPMPPQVRGAMRAASQALARNQQHATSADALTNSTAGPAAAGDTQAQPEPAGEAPDSGRRVTRSRQATAAEHASSSHVVADDTDDRPPPKRQRTTPAAESSAPQNVPPQPAAQAQPSPDSLENLATAVFRSIVSGIENLMGPLAPSRRQSAGSDAAAEPSAGTAHRQSDAPGDMPLRELSAGVGQMLHYQTDNQQPGSDAHTQQRPGPQRRTRPAVARMSAPYNPHGLLRRSPRQPRSTAGGEAATLQAAACEGGLPSLPAEQLGSTGAAAQGVSSAASRGLLTGFLRHSSGHANQQADGSTGTRHPQQATAASASEPMPFVSVLPLSRPPTRRRDVSSPLHLRQSPRSARAASPLTSPQRWTGWSTDTNSLSMMTALQHSVPSLTSPGTAAARRQEDQTSGRAGAGSGFMHIIRGLRNPMSGALPNQQDAAGNAGAAQTDARSSGPSDSSPLPPWLLWGPTHGGVQHRRATAAQPGASPDGDGDDDGDDDPGDDDQRVPTPDVLDAAMGLFEFQMSGAARDPDLDPPSIGEDAVPAVGGIISSEGGVGDAPDHGGGGDGGGGSGLPGSGYHRCYKGHSNILTCKNVEWMGHGSEYVVSGSDAGNIHVWDAETAALVNLLRGGNRAINCVKVSCGNESIRRPFLG